ncbi:hypothetical protein KFE98_12645 [bacterium SCSIO 12741]|nr:hypothetical protein KFE98_12645 [bacterium SCSIO 12741]
MAAITKYDHCTLCEHRRLDFSRGMVCGLTDEKPSFQAYCPTFKYRSDLVDYNAQMLHSVDAPEVNLLNFTSKSVGQILGGIVTLIAGILATLMLWGMGWVWGLTFGVIGFGVTSLANGLRLFIRSLKDRKEAQEKYELFVSLIELYQRHGHPVEWIEGQGSRRISTKQNRPIR